MFMRKLSLQKSRRTIKAESRKRDKSTSDLHSENRKCYECREEWHMARNCKSANIRCFKCKMIGHKSYEYTSINADHVLKDVKPSVHTLTNDALSMSRRIFKEITVLGKTILAIIGTGSDISILRYDTLLSLTDMPLEPVEKTLNSIGGRSIRTIGCLKVRAKIDANELDMVFHIVREGDIVYSAVIGNEILDQIDFVINSTGTKLRNKIPTVNLFEREVKAVADDESSDESFLFVKEVNANSKSTLEAKPIVELGAIVQSMTVDTNRIGLELEYLNKNYAEEIGNGIPPERL